MLDPQIKNIFANFLGLVIRKPIKFDFWRNCQVGQSRQGKKNLFSQDYQNKKQHFLLLAVFELTQMHSRLKQNWSMDQMQPRADEYCSIITHQLRRILQNFKFEFIIQQMDYSLNQGQKSMMQSVSKNITGNFDLDPTPLYSSPRGEIFHITNKQTKQSFALKVIWNSNNDMAYKNEKSIHSSLKNRYIVKLQNAFVDKINFYLVLEYCRNGCLRNLVNRKLDIWQVKDYGLQIAKAIDYLHKKKKIIHHQIRPQNILLTESNQVRICDFGAAAVFQEGKNLKGCEASSVYAPPEAIQMHNEKYDIWSFGCVLHEMALGKLPFCFKSWKQMALTITEAYLSNIKYDPNLPPCLVHLLKKIFVLDVSQRISIQEIMVHGFFTGQTLQVSQRMEKTEQRAVGKKKSSSKSSFKSVELKQSKVSKQNRQCFNRLHAKKSSPPNYKELIQKKFKAQRQTFNHTQKSSDQVRPKKQQAKVEELKKVNQPFLIYNAKHFAEEHKKKHFSPLNTQHMRIAPLKINNYEIRVDKQGFTRQSITANAPQKIMISCDGKEVRMKKEKKEKVYSFDSLPPKYYNQYQECKKLLAEIQAAQVRIQYLNKNFETGKALELKIMYDNSVQVRLEDQFQLRNIRAEDFAANKSSIAESRFKQLKEIYLRLNGSK